MRLLNFLWRIPIKIMKTGFSLLNLEPNEKAKTMPRKRPLHTCGASCLAIAHKACTRLQDLDGPLGSITKRAITLTNSFIIPFVHIMLYQWLKILSSMDDHILTIERTVEIIFPPSTRLFDKIDGLLCSAEVLPEHLDDIARKFPLMVHHYFPFLDWVILNLISWLNGLLSILTHWGSKNTREKEITIDVNCNDIHRCKLEQEEKSGYCNDVTSLCIDQSDSVEDKDNLVTCEVIHKSVKRLHSLKKRIRSSLDEPHCAADSPMYSSYQSANSSPVSDWSQDETYPFRQIGKSDTMNCTYKEILERVKKEDGEMKDNNVV